MRISRFTSENSRVGIIDIHKIIEQELDLARASNSRVSNFFTRSVVLIFRNDKKKKKKVEKDKIGKNKIL